MVQIVGGGNAWIGLTDSDDIAAGQREGLPVAPAALTRETLLIPNTVALVRGSPHAEAGEKLYDYLLSPPVEQALIRAQALEATEAGSTTAGISVDWDALLKAIEPTTKELNRFFAR